MNKNYKNISKIICIFAVILAFCNVNENVIAAVQTPVKAPVTTVNKVETYLSVDSLDVVANPSKYLKKNIVFEAEFVSFTALGLDYKPAFKDGTKNIGILIQRNDVKDHVIPLSEMKIFLPRKNAEKFVDLETGDKIKISGTVFSTALGDPWVEIKELKVLTKKNKAEKQDKE